MNVLNQKGTRPEDRPMRLGQLLVERRIISSCETYLHGYLYSESAACAHSSLVVK